MKGAGAYFVRNSLLAASEGLVRLAPAANTHMSHPDRTPCGLVTCDIVMPWCHLRAVKASAIYGDQ